VFLSSHSFRCKESGESLSAPHKGFRAVDEGQKKKFLRHAKREPAEADALKFFALRGAYLLPWNSVPVSSSDACAAASRAVNRRKGEHET